jgi:hypothetical protein
MKPKKPSMAVTDDFIIIRGERVPAQNVELPVHSLKFYPDNPRIYALVHVDGDDPTQDEIEVELLKAPHVRELQDRIQMNGGLLEPVFVRDGSFEVLEGNSRLAAYRALHRKDPRKWSLMRAKLLPKEMDESLVVALLVEFHLKGKKAWLPYEQAGFVHRRCISNGRDFKAVAEEMDLSVQNVRHLVDTYEFMLSHKEPTERWSYWDEYYKSRDIAKARKEHPELDKVVLKKVRNGDIPKAVDLRQDLPHICRAPKVLERFVEGKVSFEAAADQARSSGTDNVPYRKFLRFREYLVSPLCEDSLIASSENVRSSCLHELSKIEAHAKRLQARLKPKKSR